MVHRRKEEPNWKRMNRGLDSEYNRILLCYSRIIRFLLSPVEHWVLYGIISEESSIGFVTTEYKYAILLRFVSSYLKNTIKLFMESLGKNEEFLFQRIHHVSHAKQYTVSLRDEGISVNHSFSRYWINRHQGLVVTEPRNFDRKKESVVIFMLQFRLIPSE